tara:strand:- start:92 stop:904 length:813 start_codon:yes stop_codon:yes gene_type:complete
MRKMGGLHSKIPFTAVMMWIGSLAIIGFPYFSGYYSKESILENAYFSSNYMSNFAYFVGILTALLTAFYSWRLLFLTFYGKNRSEKDIYKNAHESPWTMRLPLILLAFGSIFAGIFFSEYYIGDLKYEFWNNSIILFHHHSHYLPFIQTLLIKSSVAIGILIASYFYFYNENIVIKLTKKINIFYLISLNKWYVDELYAFIFVKPYFYLSNFFWKKGDEQTIDFYGPNGFSNLIKLSSTYLSRFQSGYVYHYAFAMFGGLVILLTWFVYY